MSRVITFSRTFPSYHPKAGQPTYFVEKVLEAQGISPVGVDAFQYFEILNPKIDLPIYEDFVRELVIGGHDPKYHTIRAGHRWKTGDWVSPKVWGNDVNPKSGRKGPYHSKQIQFAPDIQIKKVWDFEIKKASKELPLDYDTDIIIDHRFFNIETAPLEELAMNDGLTKEELLAWFKYPKPFDGQIICWNENIEY